MSTPENNLDDALSIVHLLPLDSFISSRTIPCFNPQHTIDRTEIYLDELRRSESVVPFTPMQSIDYIEVTVVAQLSLSLARYS